MSKTYVLYHQNCPDGTAAALAAYLKFGENAEYIPVNYGNPVPEMEPGSRIYIVDFSYPVEILKQIAGNHKTVTVIDHHKTAQSDLSPDGFIEAGFESKAILFRPDGFMVVSNIEIKFDMTKSGAVLTWEHFHNEPVPLFLLYIQDRDLWQFKLAQSREVSAAIGSYPVDFRIWANWLKEEDIINDLAQEGITCLRLKNQQVDIMAKNHRWACFDLPAGKIHFHSERGIQRPEEGWHWAPVANASVFFSEVGERMLELNPDALFSAYYFDRKNGVRQWGLRSRKEFDCSSIARNFSGGGHAQASGFTQPL